MLCQIECYYHMLHKTTGVGVKCLCDGVYNIYKIYYMPFELQCVAGRAD
jgi:hypothetical protein